MRNTTKLKVKRSIRDLAAGVASTLLVLAVLSGLLALAGGRRYGSVANAVAALRGEILVVHPAARHIGVLEAGQKVTLEYRVTSLSSAPVRLVGSHSSCSCTVPDRLPQTLEPRATLVVRVRFEAPEQLPATMEGLPFHQEVVVYTSDASRSQFTLALSGEVRRRVPPAKHADGLARPSMVQ